MSDNPCSTVVGFDPNGSIADGTDHIRCNKTPTYLLAPDPWDFYLCAEHKEMYSRSKADMNLKDAIAKSWTGTPYGIGNENSVDSVLDGIYAAGYTIGPAQEKRKINTQDRILRNKDSETIDEIVCRNVTVHLEKMSDDCHWMGVDHSDGTHSLMVNFFINPKTLKLECYVEDDGEPWPWGEDKTHE